MTGTQRDDDERQQELATVILKILGVAVTIGLVVGIGAWVVVKGLGLDSSSTTSSSSPGQPVAPLPTTALPVPSDTSSPSGLPTATPTAPPTGALYLSASPLMVQPMERINLTGQWPGHDNQSLLVQRFEGGSWSNFGVQVSVKVGTFETYVMTGRPGDQKFRVFDPTTQTASNEVTITVGS